MKKFILSVAFFVVLAPGLALSKESTFPACDGPDSWAADITITHMVNSGLLKDAGDIADRKSLSVKILDSKRIGRLLTPGSPPEILYRQVLKVSLKNKDRKPFELIVISDASNIECSMSTPGVILISPYFKVVSEGRPYSGKLVD